MADNFYEDLYMKGRRGMVIVYVAVGVSMVGIYTTFANGRIPFLNWETDHNLGLGFVWLFFVAPLIITITRTVQQIVVAHAVGVFQSGKLLLAGFNGLLQIYLLSVAVIAWFPSDQYLPIPFLRIQGGFMYGIVFTVVAAGVMIIGNWVLGVRLEADKVDFKEQHRASKEL
jgi:hypothetical protein